ncbi:hypothetical protein RDWZM_006587 [Blomia tropicalis]|uniref:Sushi domain-containing protein n=1 Tax=Blomia tropicalis TaxID=40697 RepID=A0A9Q0MBR6_BLOTA|nr:hypothetical protein RDWZM_006587 [Blomia tropicalis]
MKNAEPTAISNKPFLELVEVSSYCNDPGQPFKSKYTPVQKIYTDGETVEYTCDEYISLKQYRKCVHGHWEGDTPICGNAFRNNDLVMAKYYDRDTMKLLSQFNVTGRLQPFAKFGNSFIAERISTPVRGTNASNYYIELLIDQPAMIQMVRLSFSVVNHLTDETIRDSHFTIDRVAVSPYRQCDHVANKSVSPWHFNSTRYDYWFFCRSKSPQDFELELTRLSRLLLIETSSNAPVDIDLATFILAEQYSTNDNRSDPICGLPEVPIGLERSVINDQTNYLFQCSKDFKRIDNVGGQSHLKRCGYDLRWHGEFPECYPIKTCSKFQTKNLLVDVYKYDRIFYHGSDWLPIKGSRAFFHCKDETHIFVGKEIRICDEEGEWSNSMPNCLISAASDPSLRTNTILIIVLTTLIVTFVLSSCTIYCFLKLRSTQTDKMNGMNQMELDEASYYATGGMGPISAKLADDSGQYECLDAFPRYDSLNAYGQPNHTIDASQAILVKTSPFESNNEYVKDFPSHFPVPAPRHHFGNKTENEYYDDTVDDNNESMEINPKEYHTDSYQAMQRM